MDKIFKDKNRDDEINRIFEAYDDDMDGKIPLSFLIEQVQMQGFNMLEEKYRFQEIQEYINSLPLKSKSEIDCNHFAKLIEMTDGEFIEKALLGKLIVPDFSEFTESIAKIYDIVEHVKDGENASYIPQLAEVDSNLFSIAACTVDGQQCDIGDSDTYFCVQSCSKAITYCIAVEESGIDYVHKHVGKEPSGASFNKNFLNPQNLPHNPMINSGAIMTAALVSPDLEMYKRYEYVKKFWSSLAGGARIGFQNATYLSEKDTASRNFCLGHMMKDAKAFPENINLEEVLDFYFQICSLETTSKDMAIIAASLANGGVCPMTKKRIFKEDTVNHCLSLMHSCGMYDYSGEWAYSVGIPAKSGVGGCVFLVVPKVMGICIFSPRLDSRGNSVRGIEASKLLLKEYTMHRYDNLKGVVTPFSHKVSLLQSMAEQKNEFTKDLLNAVADDDLHHLQCILEEVKEENFDINSIKDYDDVTPAHVACSFGHEEILHYLIELDAEFRDITDKWGKSPLDRASEAGHKEVVKILHKLYHSDRDHSTGDRD
ncbi:unnamed protein product [Moneuplotes crassus]|uniref:glutaminase n=1 Tax=Euplotes crassus TaxID=5936 RepID=A0AAD1XB36_EUPCR|nr:unnamed protein product [Moneuplotes crassus]